jgi:glycosyltransferase involved in cell wall biosynthesis
MSIHKSANFDKKSNMTKISAVIVAHNEEKKIAQCLQSLSFVDEIVVVLDKCTDDTKEIVKKFTDKIIEGSWHLEGTRRNVAVNAATCEWILEIDADERISKELADEILQAIKNCEPCAFIAPIANYIAKRHVKYGWLRTLGVDSRQTIHYQGLKKYDEDKEIHPTATLNCAVKFLKNPITHLVDDDISDLLNRFNRYTRWRANDINRNKKSSSSLLKSIISFKLRFLKSFFLKKGYKEGNLGFLIAVLSGLYPIVSALKSAEVKKTK